MTQTEMPEQIEVVFTEEDFKNAGPYTDRKNCLMATALKRMGYNHDTPLNISCFGVSHINNVVYRPSIQTPFDAHRVEVSNPYRTDYDKSVIGMKVVLIRER